MYMSKQKIFVKTIITCILIALIPFVFSCSSEITIQAKSDSSSTIQIQSDIGKTVLETINAVTVGMNEISGSVQSDKPIFSSKQIKDAFTLSDMTDIAVETPTVSSFKITGIMAAPGKQKVVLDDNTIKLANFITCTNNSLTLILSPLLIRSVIDTFPEEQKSFFDLFMAPVFTGEEMSAVDYNDLIGAVYGDKMSSELTSSLVKITLYTPEGTSLKRSALSEAKNVKTFNNRAVFSIPLSEFLTLSETKTFSISW